MWADVAQVCVHYVPNLSACLKSLSASIIVVASSSARSTYAAAHLNKFKFGLKAEILHFSLSEKTWQLLLDHQNKSFLLSGVYYKQQHWGMH